MSATTVSEFVEAVEEVFGRFSTGSNYDLWFRGLKRATFPLVAGAQRAPCCFGEDTVCAEFLIHAPALMGARAMPHDPWEVFALMQHHRIPTRLLDWTRSPLMALFFAVEADPSHDAEPAAVKILNPVGLNRDSLGLAEVLSCVRPQAQQYLPTRLQQLRSPDVSPADLPPKAVAFEAPMSNARIAAQRGCFTVSGSLSDSISSAPDSIVGEIVIPADAKTRILEGLRHLAFSEDAVFQDLDSLAARIKREFFAATP